MKLSFLEAREPLTKTFSLDANGTLVKSNYPIVKDFKSHTEIINTPKEFCEALSRHAALGHCLLKGELQHELNWESRAGATNAHTSTSYICFDLDLEMGLASTEDFITHLCSRFPCYREVSYIVAYSASYMVHKQTALRAHIFFLCDSIAAPLLKQHLMEINLELFEKHIKLTRTHAALSWPVDITVCQNDKLIYIAPPTLEAGVIDYFPAYLKRIELIQKAQSIVPITSLAIPPLESMKSRSTQLVNSLREAIGLPKRRTYDYKFQGTQSYLPTKDAASVTGMRELNGYVRLNLNGGDSWAYYHPVGHPEFIYSFKGDGPYLTKELLPDYWQQCKSSENITKIAQQQLKKAQSSKTNMYFGIRSFKHARYFAVVYDSISNTVSLKDTPKDQLSDFLQSHNQPVPDFYYDWELYYDPTVTMSPYEPIDLVGRRINMFKPSPYMAPMSSAASPLSTKVTQCPPTIHRVLGSLFNHDPDHIAHFHNWLAYILRKRNKTGTAFVFQGIEGTGKGVLFNNIIKPLLGESNAEMIRMQELEDNFNGRFEFLLFATIDEADMSENPKKLSIMANLKNQITEPRLSVRRMYVEGYSTPNFTNYTFNSNMRQEPVVVSSSNRRFDIAPYQRIPLRLTEQDIEMIAKELETYAKFLWDWQLDEKQVRKPYESEALKSAIENSRSSIDMIAEWIREGDIKSLWDSLPQHPENLSIEMGERYKQYKALLDDIVRTKRTKLHRDEILVIFQFTVGNIPASPAKFTRFCGHHDLEIRPIYLDGKAVRGVEIARWNAEDTWFETTLKSIDTPKLQLVPKALEA